MNLLRFIFAVALVAGLVFLLAHGGVAWLASSAAAALLVWALVMRDLPRRILSLGPILFFCAVLALLDLIAHRPSSLLPLQAFASYAVLMLSVQLLPWARVARSVSPPSRFFLPVLFLLFVYHFTVILKEETRQLLTAYRLAVPYPFRRGGLRALAYSLDSLFRRCLARAERFYAAQILRGIAE